MARVLNGFSAWPDTAVDLTTEQVVKMYQEGFAGAYQDPEESEALNDEIRASGGEVSGEDLATSYGFAGNGAGKLVILYPAVVQYYGLGGLTKPGQKTGDCVSMAGRDVCLFTICLEAAAGLADERTGKVEAPPKVSETARKNGVFVNEGIYLARGHSGQGMSCSEGARWVTTKGGIVIRQKYPQVDLEEYNVEFEVPGKRGVPDWLNEVGRQHPIYDMTRPKGHEAARDFIDRGKAVWNCSGLGFSSKRDQWGHSERKGGWSHSWHTIGYDDRPVTIKEYGKPQALSGHRWAVWNSGGRRIIDSQGLVPSELKSQWQQWGIVDAEGYILIPEGYWWHDAPLLDGNDMYVGSGANGWASAALPDLSPGFK